MNTIYNVLFGFEGSSEGMNFVDSFNDMDSVVKCITELCDEHEYDVNKLRYKEHNNITYITDINDEIQIEIHEKVMR